jgi:pimeloyl-ACP methyl ester carboxylesterase
MPAPDLIATNGITMGVYQAGSGIPVIFCHGFPELAYSWRHQFHAVAELGFHAIAPDLRGYGLTDRPEQVSAYTTATICDDLVGMMDNLGLEKAIFCGHDWGGYVVDTMPLLYPERCLGIIGIGAHNNQRPPDLPWPDIEINNLLDKEGFNQFVQLPETEVFLDSHAKELFEVMFRSNYFTADYLAALPEDAPERKIHLIDMISGNDHSTDIFVSEEEFNYYAQTYSATGFGGGINWYRAIPATVDELDYRTLHWGVDVPYLYIWPEQDPINQDGLNVDMEAYIPDLEKVELTGSGHFAMEEKPEELSAFITEWLARKY